MPWWRPSLPLLSSASASPSALEEEDDSNLAPVFFSPLEEESESSGSLVAQVRNHGNMQQAHRHVSVIPLGDIAAAGGDSDSDDDSEDDGESDDDTPDSATQQVSRPSSAQPSPPPAAAAAAANAAANASDSDDDDSDDDNVPSTQSSRQTAAAAAAAAPVVQTNYATSSQTGGGSGIATNLFNLDADKEARRLAFAREIRESRKQTKRLREEEKAEFENDPDFDDDSSSSDEDDDEPLPPGTTMSREEFREMRKQARVLEELRMAEEAKEAEEESKLKVSPVDEGPHFKHRELGRRTMRGADSDHPSFTTYNTETVVGERNTGSKGVRANMRHWTELAKPQGHPANPPSSVYKMYDDPKTPAPTQIDPYPQRFANEPDAAYQKRCEEHEQNQQAASSSTTLPTEELDPETRDYRIAMRFPFGEQQRKLGVKTWEQIVRKSTKHNIERRPVVGHPTEKYDPRTAGEKRKDRNTYDMYPDKNVTIPLTESEADECKYEAAASCKVGQTAAHVKLLPKSMKRRAVQVVTNPYELLPLKSRRDVEYNLAEHPKHYNVDRFLFAHGGGSWVDFEVGVNIRPNAVRALMGPKWSPYYSAAAEDMIYLPPPPRHDKSRGDGTSQSVMDLGFLGDGGASASSRSLLNALETSRRKRDEESTRAIEKKLEERGYPRNVIRGYLLDYERTSHPITSHRFGHKILEEAAEHVNHLQPQFLFAPRRALLYKDVVNSFLDVLETGGASHTALREMRHQLSFAATDPEAVSPVNGFLKTGRGTSFPVVHDEPFLERWKSKIWESIWPNDPPEMAEDNLPKAIPGNKQFRHPKRDYIDLEKLNDPRTRLDDIEYMSLPHIPTATGQAKLDKMVERMLESVRTFKLRKLKDEAEHKARFEAKMLLGKKPSTDIVNHPMPEIAAQEQLHESIDDRKARMIVDTHGKRVRDRTTLDYDKFDELGEKEMEAMYKMSKASVVEREKAARSKSVAVNNNARTLFDKPTKKLTAEDKRRLAIVPEPDLTGRREQLDREAYARERRQSLDPEAAHKEETERYKVDTEITSIDDFPWDDEEEIIYKEEKPKIFPDLDKLTVVPGTVFMATCTARNTLAIDVMTSTNAEGETKTVHLAEVPEMSPSLARALLLTSATELKMKVDAAKREPSTNIPFLKKLFRTEGILEQSLLCLRRRFAASIFSAAAAAPNRKARIESQYAAVSKSDEGVPFAEGSSEQSNMLSRYWSHLLDRKPLAADPRFNSTAPGARIFVSMGNKDESIRWDERDAINMRKARGKGSQKGPYSSSPALASHWSVPPDEVEFFPMRAPLSIDDEANRAGQQSDAPFLLRITSRTDQIASSASRDQLREFANSNYYGFNASTFSMSEAPSASSLVLNGIRRKRLWEMKLRAHTSLTTMPRTPMERLKVKLNSDRKKKKKPFFLRRWMSAASRAIRPWRVVLEAEGRKHRFTREALELDSDEIDRAEEKGDAARLTAYSAIPPLDPAMDVLWPKDEKGRAIRRDNVYPLPVYKADVFPTRLDTLYDSSNIIDRTPWGYALWSYGIPEIVQGLESPGGMPPRFMDSAGVSLPAFKAARALYGIFPDVAFDPVLENPALKVSEFMMAMRLLGNASRVDKSVEERPMGEQTDLPNEILAPLRSIEEASAQKAMGEDKTEGETKIKPIDANAIYEDEIANRRLVQSEEPLFSSLFARYNVLGYDPRMEMWSPSDTREKAQKLFYDQLLHFLERNSLFKGEEDEYLLNRAVEHLKETGKTALEPGLGFTFEEKGGDVEKEYANLMSAADAALASESEYFDFPIGRVYSKKEKDVLVERLESLDAVFREKSAQMQIPVRLGPKSAEEYASKLAAIRESFLAENGETTLRTLGEMKDRDVLTVVDRANVDATSQALARHVPNISDTPMEVKSLDLTFPGADESWSTLRASFAKHAVKAVECALEGRVAQARESLAVADAASIPADARQELERAIDVDSKALARVRELSRAHASRGCDGVRGMLTPDEQAFADEYAEQRESNPRPNDIASFLRGDSSSPNTSWAFEMFEMPENSASDDKSQPRKLAFRYKALDPELQRLKEEEKLAKKHLVASLRKKRDIMSESLWEDGYYCAADSEDPSAFQRSPVVQRLILEAAKSSDPWNTPLLSSAMHESRGEAMASHVQAGWPFAAAAAATRQGAEESDNMVNQLASLLADKMHLEDELTAMSRFALPIKRVGAEMRSPHQSDILKQHSRFNQAFESLRNNDSVAFRGKMVAHFRNRTACYGGPAYTSINLHPGAPVGSYQAEKMADDSFSCIFDHSLVSYINSHSPVAGWRSPEMTVRDAFLQTFAKNFNPDTDMAIALDVIRNAVPKPMCEFRYPYGKHSDAELYSIAEMVANKQRMLHDHAMETALLAAGARDVTNEKRRGKAPMFELHSENLDKTSYYVTLTHEYSKKDKRPTTTRVSVFRNLVPKSREEWAVQNAHAILQPYDIYSPYSRNLDAAMAKTFKDIEFPYQPPMRINDVQREILNRQPNRVTPNNDTQRQQIETTRIVKGSYPDSYTYNLGRALNAVDKF